MTGDQLTLVALLWWYHVVPGVAVVWLPALMALAIVGVMVLAGSGRVREAALLATVLLYVSAVHFPLLTEVRQSLPAKPVVLVLAAIGALAWPWRHRRQRDAPRMQAC